MSTTRAARDLTAKINALRVGPGALILQQDVKRIVLQFYSKYNTGNISARKFWRKYYPQLKYHNPGLSTLIESHDDPEGTSQLRIYWNKNSEPASPPSEPCTRKGDNDERKWTRIETIEMRHKHESEVLQQMKELTGATLYSPDSVETLQRRVIEEDKKKRTEDRDRQAKINRQLKEEQRLYQQAKAS